MGGWGEREEGRKGEGREGGKENEERKEKREKRKEKREKKKEKREKRGGTSFFFICFCFTSSSRHFFQAERSLWVRITIITEVLLVEKERGKVHKRREEKERKRKEKPFLNCGHIGKKKLDLFLSRIENET